MFDENPLSVNPTEIAAPDAPLASPENGVESVVETPTEVKPDAVVETDTTQETKQPDVDDPKVPPELREHLKGLERDLKTYKPAFVGLETAAKTLFGTSTPEDVQAAIQTVQALAPQIKVLTDSNATQADVVSTLQQMLPPENMEALAWHVLNNPANHEAIFTDSEVVKAIEDRFLQGRTFAEIESLLANAPETEADPEREAWRREQASFQAERQREASERTTREANQRSSELASRFFEEPTKRILAEDFKLAAPEGASEADKQLFADTAEDIGYVAQARFAKENMAAFMQIDQLYRQGRQVQAQAAEIRLANRYHATLIKTAERHVNLLKSRSVAVVNDQQGKINGVRTEVSGSVEAGQQKQGPVWDYDKPDAEAMVGFQNQFHN